MDREEFNSAVDKYREAYQLELATRTRLQTDTSLSGTKKDGVEKALKTQESGTRNREAEVRKVGAANPDISETEISEKLELARNMAVRELIERENSDLLNKLQTLKSVRESFEKDHKGSDFTTANGLQADIDLIKKKLALYIQELPEEEREEVKRKIEEHERALLGEKEPDKEATQETEGHTQEAGEEPAEDKSEEAEEEQEEPAEEKKEDHDTEEHEIEDTPKEGKPDIEAIKAGAIKKIEEAVANFGRKYISTCDKAVTDLRKIYEDRIFGKGLTASGVGSAISEMHEKLKVAQKEALDEEKGIDSAYDRAEVATLFVQLIDEARSKYGLTQEEAEAILKPALLQAITAKLNDMVSKESSHSLYAVKIPGKDGKEGSDYGEEVKRLDSRIKVLEGKKRNHEEDAELAAAKEMLEIFRGMQYLEDGHGLLKELEEGREGSAVEALERKDGKPVQLLEKDCEEKYKREHVLSEPSSLTAAQEELKAKFLAAKDTLFNPLVAQGLEGAVTYKFTEKTVKGKDGKETTEPVLVVQVNNDGMLTKSGMVNTTNATVIVDSTTIRKISEFVSRDKADKYYSLKTGKKLEEEEAKALVGKPGMDMNPDELDVTEVPKISESLVTTKSGMQQLVVNTKDGITAIAVGENSSPLTYDQKQEIELYTEEKKKELLESSDKALKDWESRFGVKTGEDLEGEASTQMMETDDKNSAFRQKFAIFGKENLAVGGTGNFRRNSDKTQILGQNFVSFVYSKSEDYAQSASEPKPLQISISIKKGENETSKTYYLGTDGKYYDSEQFSRCSSLEEMQGVDLETIYREMDNLGIGSKFIGNVMKRESTHFLHPTDPDKKPGKDSHISDSEKRLVRASGKEASLDEAARKAREELAREGQDQEQEQAPENSQGNDEKEDGGRE